MVTIDDVKRELEPYIREGRIKPVALEDYKIDMLVRDANDYGEVMEWSRAQILEYALSEVMVADQRVHYRV